MFSVIDIILMCVFVSYCIIKQNYIAFVFKIYSDLVIFLMRLMELVLK